jgi:hypothetical protein
MKPYRLGGVEEDVVEDDDDNDDDVDDDHDVMDVTTVVGGGSDARDLTAPDATKERKLREAAAQAKAKERIRHILSDTNKTPLELIFVGRNMNITRAINKELGSPVNRLNIMARLARAALADAEAAERATLGRAAQWRFAINDFMFSARLWVVNAAYALSSVWVNLNKVAGRRVKSFEEFVDAEEARVRNSFLHDDWKKDGKGKGKKGGKESSEKRRRREEQLVQRRATMASIDSQTEFDVREHVLERRRKREAAKASGAPHLDAVV